jgi:putative oxidoreductase
MATARMNGVRIMDAGLLLARVAFGVLIAAHGSQKLFGWFGGYGLDGTGGFFENIGFRPGRLFAAIASVSEVAGGALVALGLLHPFGAALVVAVMVVAASVHWPNGLFAPTGIELPLLYAVITAALTLTGPGSYSVDALLGWTSLWTPSLTWSVLGLGLLGGVGNLALKRPLPSVAAA